MKRRARRAGSASKSSFLDPLLCSSVRLTAMREVTLPFVSLANCLLKCKCAAKLNGFLCSRRCLQKRQEGESGRRRARREGAEEEGEAAAGEGEEGAEGETGAGKEGAEGEGEEGERDEEEIQSEWHFAAFGGEELREVSDEPEEGGERTNLSGFIPRRSSARTHAEGISVNIVSLSAIIFSSAVYYYIEKRHFPQELLYPLPHMPELLPAAAQSSSWIDVCVCCVSVSLMRTTYLP